MIAPVYQKVSFPGSSLLGLLLPFRISELGWAARICGAL